MSIIRSTNLFKSRIRLNWWNFRPDRLELACNSGKSIRDIGGPIILVKREDLWAASSVTVAVDAYMNVSDPIRNSNMNCGQNFVRWWSCLWKELFKIHGTWSPIHGVGLTGCLVMNRLLGGFSSLMEVLPMDCEGNSASPLSPIVGWWVCSCLFGEPGGFRRGNSCQKEACAWISSGRMSDSDRILGQIVRRTMYLLTDVWACTFTALFEEGHFPSVRKVARLVLLKKMK